MKAKTGAVVRVTVGSKLADLKDKTVFGKLVDKSATWDSFLKNHGINLNENEHCISALAGKVTVSLNDKVSKVIDSYVKKMVEYKVWIVVKTPRNSARLGQQEPTRRSSKQRASSRKKKPTKRLITEVEQPVYLNGSDMDDGDYLEDENGYEDENIEEALEVAHSSNNGNQDDFVFAMPQGRAPRSYSGARSWNDRMETASAISQDTFDGDIGEDIKSVVIARLRDWATNGDLHRLREELHSLQVNRKNLKVARYIPYTMNVLGVLFGGT